MTPLWKKKPALGIGIGVGLVGALALALRLRRRDPRVVIPDSITPAIFANRACDTSRGRIVYHTSGSGEPLVFLHGFYPGASSYEWSKIYVHYAAGAKVIVPDLIGFGESERPPKPLDGDEHVESLAELLRHTATQQQAAVVASGISCQLALLLASRHPELVSRMFLFLPSAFRSSVQRRAFELPSSFLPTLNRIRYRNITANPNFISNWLTSMFANRELISLENVDVLTSCARQYGASHAITGFHRNRATFAIGTRLPDVHAPVHIVWPENAPLFPIEEAHTLCSALPCASFKPLSTSSLLAPLEHPEMLSQDLKIWHDRDPVALAI
jgi:pimeloyl-ACP methyl ester carboxylesterase